uniref:Peptidase S1 domain-containing protein n=1 Tax=Timema bartmani TaxID=61472 RepID=A0A7R9I718_9NEOP|nr:unnamed protein product [Timema bartmani]
MEEYTTACRTSDRNGTIGAERIGHFSYLHFNGGPNTGSDLIVKLNIGLERNESGDSGGPVVYKGKLIGIVSFMRPDDCLSKYAPHVHTKVISHKKWIQKYLKV